MLSKRFRLTKHGSFSYVYRKGACHKSRTLNLYVAPSASLKIGFSVSNKIGKAVVRNKLKRRLRSATKNYLDKIAPSQLVFLAKDGINKSSFAMINAEIAFLLTKARLI